MTDNLMLKNTNILFLHSFFSALQKAGFILGFDEYLLLFDALKAGFGLKDEADLKFICKKLWLKNIEDEALFDSIFEEEFSKEKENAKIYFENLKPIIEAQEDKEGNTDTGENNTEAQDDKEKNTDTEKNNDENKPYTEEDKKADSDPEEANNDKQEENRIEEDTIKLSIENIEQTKMQELDYEKEIIPENKFIYSGNYYSLKSNKILNILKFLHHKEENQTTSEININETIKKYIEQGIIIKPVYYTSKKEKSELLILIDHSKSMIAFLGLIDYIAEIMSKSKFTDIQKYYFFEIPGKLIFLNISHTRAENSEFFLQKLKKKNTSLIIYSDAYSAYGYVDDKKVYAIQKFIKKITKITKQVVWINPMPRNRWKNTNAMYIMKKVPMFSCTEQGLNSAIKVLKDKIFFEKVLKNSNL